MFSFNSPFGACEACTGLGICWKSIRIWSCPTRRSRSRRRHRALERRHTMGSWNHQIMLSVCKHFKIPLDKPYEKLTEKHRKILLYGSGDEKILMKWEARRRGPGQFKRTSKALSRTSCAATARATPRNPSLDRRFHVAARLPACKGPGLKRRALPFLSAAVIADLFMSIDA